MINIEDLTSEDIGRTVIYRQQSSDTIEEGVISHWNKQFIFVIYRDTDNAKVATAPYLLTFKNNYESNKKWTNRKSS